MCVCLAPIFCCSFKVPVHQLSCSSRLSLSENSVPKSLVLVFLFYFFYAEICVWSQQVYNQTVKGLRGSWEEGYGGSMQSGRCCGGSVPFLSKSGSSLSPPYCLQLPVTFPTDSCIAKLRPQKSNLNSILLPKLIGPICSSGTLRQCLPAQLHFVSIEISNNVCWLAVSSSGVVIMAAGTSLHRDCQGAVS